MSIWILTSVNQGYYKINKRPDRQPIIFFFFRSWSNYTNCIDIEDFTFRTQINQLTVAGIIVFNSLLLNKNGRSVCLFLLKFTILWTLFHFSHQEILSNFHSHFLLFHSRLFFCKKKLRRKTWIYLIFLTKIDPKNH